MLPQVLDLAGTQDLFPCKKLHIVPLNSLNLPQPVSGYDVLYMASFIHHFTISSIVLQDEHWKHDFASFNLSSSLVKFQL